jgi:hypothetical protein
MVHNLERPVYLTGIEVRSDALTGDDPSHPLDQVFQSGQTSYTVTVPYNAQQITIDGFPEEGAWISGEKARNFDLTRQELSFTFTVSKEFRLSTTYTVNVLRGLPEAVLSDLGLYLVNVDSAYNPEDPDFLEHFETANYIVNFAPARETYTLKVPAYTDHLVLIARSPGGEANKVTRIEYEFKDWEGKPIGADGVTSGAGYVQSRETAEYSKAPQPPSALPSWYKDEVLSLGDIMVYPGTIDGNPAWYHRFLADDPLKPKKGRNARIEITAMSDELSPKKYIIELQREEAVAYLADIKVYGITGAVPLNGSGGTMPDPDPLFPGTVDTSKNRIIGNFARTNLSYDAALPAESGSGNINGVQIVPVRDKYSGNTTAFSYTPYYYDSAGVRWIIASSGLHIKEEEAPSPSPIKVLTDTNVYSGVTAPTDATGTSFYFDTINDSYFQKYVRMEIEIKVEPDDIAAEANYYRVTVRFQRPQAVLSSIKVEPNTPVDSINDGNVFTNSVLNNPDFSPHAAYYTVNVNAGRSHARIKLQNEGSAAPRTANRIITISSPDESFSFYRSAGDASWTDGTDDFGTEPEANVALTSRNTTVTITISDVPAFTPQTYTLNILSKTSNDIILPSDEESNGRLRAYFASGPKQGVTAEHVLPGEHVEVTVEANLGWYIDWERNPYSVPGGTDAGVGVTASAISMGTGIGKIWLVSDPNDWKQRVYQFFMPDENVVFHVEYRETAEKHDRIAYVAPPDKARRGGGYKSGEDRQTATSWGTASHDLQAVINSFHSGDLDAIWVLKGTYTPPDPDNYEVVTRYNVDNYGKDNNCFPDPAGNSPGVYHVTGYDFTGMTNKEDIAFVLRPAITMLGGFDETDDELSDRDQRIAVESFEPSILSGENLEDGTRAHHVVLAVGAGNVEMNGFMISGGMGPETGSTINVYPPKPGSGVEVGTERYPVNRQHGGGIYAADSSLQLTNVTISSNKSTNGAGMYSSSQSDSTSGSTLRNVDFFNNTALESGGGMYNTGCNPKIENSRFRGNTSVNQGGGLYVNGGDLHIVNSQFQSNSAKIGGGVFNSGGSSVFDAVRVFENWTSGDGSGIWNGSSAYYYNLTVYDNVSRGGGGIAIYNGGTIRMTNATLAKNIRLDGTSPYGGGLYNAGRAGLANVTIRNNSATMGGGIYNTGFLVLANCIVSRNEASGSGGGIVNIAGSNARAMALLANVTLAGNEAGSRGGAVYNEYEGYPQGSPVMAGSVNEMLQNVRITGNKAGSGGGIFNRYFRYSGMGIFLTLSNTTIAGNAGGGLYTKKDNSNDG